MRKLLIIIFMICVTASATETKVTKTQEINTTVPKFLEGATIEVILKDGKVVTMSIEDFKVVPRKQQFLVTEITTETQVIVKGEDQKNRISVLGGVGLDGSVDIQNNGSSLGVKPGMGAVGGLQYQRKFTDRFSLGLQGQTNGSGFVLIGTDF